MAKVLASGLSREVQPIGEVRETRRCQPSPEVKALPFYNLLPTDHVELLRFRIYVRKRCLTDLAFRADILEMCRQDICFFANLFCFVFEPRPPRKIPVKLWSDQADCLAWAWECFGKRDMGVEKTRGIGFSCLMAILYYFAARFVDEAKLGITTKDETALDGPDANTILGKIVYLHHNMPAWFRLNRFGKDVLKRNTTEHMLLFTDNQSTVQGFVPTDDKIRSMRFTSFFYDEFAFFPRNAQASLNAAVHTSPNRFFVSTWNGSDNEFHVLMRVEKSTMLRVLTYWWENEERWKGCYVAEKGVLKIIDGSYDFPPDYPFDLDRDGMLRSPWVDFELRRAGSNVQSALEELYGLQAEYGRKLFRAATIEIVNTTVKQFRARGDIVDQGDGPAFVPSRTGAIIVWGELGDTPDQGGIKGGPFSAASDLGEGLGASYSTLEIVNLAGGEQVLEVATDDLDPVSFARYCVLILNWVNGKRGDGHTHMTFENNGRQGTVFGNEMATLYGNLMERVKAGRTLGRNEPGNTYLGMRNRDGGLLVLMELQRAVQDGDCSVRSDDVLHEMHVFDKDENDKPNYPRGEKSHGDRVMALAMAWFQGRERLEVAPLEYRELARIEMEQAIPRSHCWSDSWTL